MTLTEIKKDLYKQKPTATLSSIRRGLITYFCEAKGLPIMFQIPINDIGDGLFESTMPAHLLIRYIVVPEKETIP